jgi:hypothetical protein
VALALVHSPLEFLLGNEISGAYSKKKSLQIKSIILNLNYKKQIF